MVDPASWHRYEMPPSRRPAPLLQLIRLLLTCDSELRPDITAVMKMLAEVSAFVWICGCDGDSALSQTQSSKSIILWLEWHPLIHAILPVCHLSRSNGTQHWLCLMSPDVHVQPEGFSLHVKDAGFQVWPAPSTGEHSSFSLGASHVMLK